MLLHRSFPDRSVLTCSPSRNASTSAFDHHLGPALASISRSCVVCVCLGCCLQHFWSDLILRQAHQLRGDCDLPLDLLREPLSGGDGLLKSRRIVARSAAAPLGRRCLL